MLDRRVHHRGPNAAPAIAERLGESAAGDGLVVVTLDRWRGRRARTPTAPRHQVPQPRPQHEHLLAGVDRAMTVDELRELPQLIQVRVRLTRDLPRDDPLRIRLARRQRPDRAAEVPLRLHEQHRNAHVLAQPHRAHAERRPDVRAPTTVVERQEARAATVEEEGVEHPDAGVHPVDVGGQRERRLRLAHRDHRRRPQITERARGCRSGPRIARVAADLRDDAVGVRVPRVVQVAVTPGPRGAQPRRLPAHPHRGVTALHRDELRGHPHPHVPGAQDLLREVREIGGRVLAAADVEPLHQHHAAERGRVGRAAHEHAGGVRRGVGVGELEASVLRRGGRIIGGGHAGHRPLGLDEPGRG